MAPRRPTVCCRTDGWRGAFNNGTPFTHNPRGIAMLYTIAVILIILWLVGVVTSFTLGGFIHILLIVAIISVLLRLIG
jgi:hypothetical protein